MKSGVSILKTIFLIFSAFGAISCGLSIPNLESSECIESRNTVKEFYSFHFGNDLRPSIENLERREKFLTAELFQRLKEISEAKRDYFTQTEDYPKAFSVGVCEAVSPEQTNFDVLIFWKDDIRTEQRELKVETIKKDGNWLINKVENK